MKDGPVFGPRFDEIPDQIARRNASQTLKFRAYGLGAKSNDGLELQGLHISNAQHLTIYLEIVANEGS